MDSDRWARVKKVFHGALECEPERRGLFLRDACAGDESLRETVESMLARESRAAGFLESPALEAQAKAIAAELRGTPSASAKPPPLPTPAQSHLRRHPASRRPPWWILLLAVVFLADSLLRAWCHVAGPRGFDLTVELQGGRHVVTAVAAGGLAEEAGIKLGDVIVARDGQPFERVSNPRVTRPNLVVGRTYGFEVERDGRRASVAIRAQRMPILGRQYLGSTVLWQVAMLAMLATAFLIAFTRPWDPMARLGALTLAALGVSLWLFNLPPGYAAIVRSLPWGLGALALAPNLAVALVGPIGLTFFLLFPRPLFRTRWPWVFVWLPALSFVPAFVHANLIIYWPEEAYLRSAISAWGRPLAAGGYGAYGLLMLAAITANYVRLSDPDEKRRLRVLVAGGALGTLPGLARIVASTVLPQSALSEFMMYGWPDLPIAAAFLLFPMSFAYALLRHRVLGVRVIVRLGVQYALARGLVISLVPVLGLVLVVDALVHSDHPLIEIVRARGSVYAVLAGLAVLVHTQRHRMGRAIDRRFFREHYDSSHLLREVAEEARRAGSLQRAGPAVVARIEAALQPEFAALLFRPSGEAEFRPVAAAPAGMAPPAIGEDDPVLARLRAADRPLEVGERVEDMPESPVSGDETDGPHRPRVELLVPIAMSPESHEALLAFGAKRSQEPYTREDLDSLAAIASSLALLLEGPTPMPDRLGSVFEECPRCGSCYDSGVSVCANGQVPLVTVGMPRTLAGRYHLEQRLGRGGMGKVYEAVDVALDRRVAVKVIRDEWVHSASAAARFRREARAVAGFAHPNVVTVYDYGVEAGSRAFLVMELLHGVTLREELRRRRRLDAARTVEVFRGVCGAVEAAHRHHLVHRDLKPENIFLTDRAGGGATVKVLDFGVAKPLAGSDEALEPDDGAADTEIGVLVGTIGYLSPEQLLGERPEVSWDLWALAVVAYEALTGALPFPVASRDRGAGWCWPAGTRHSVTTCPTRRRGGGTSSPGRLQPTGPRAPARPRSSSGNSSPRSPDHAAAGRGAALPRGIGWCAIGASG